MLNEGYVYRERVEGGGSLRLLDWISSRYRHSTRECWRRRIVDGEVLVEGEPSVPDTKLHQGQEVAWHRPPWREEEVPLRFETLWEDEWIVAVSKPSGLPTMPGGGFLQNTLFHLVRERWSDANPLHRLGRGTSGLVLFSRTSEVGAILGARFRDRSIERRYLALASGRPTWKRKVETTPIGPIAHRLLGTVHAASSRGRSAETSMEVLEIREGHFLMGAELRTGRPHQIRIHAAASGHPLVGDPLFEIGGTPREDTRPGEGGYSLHAHSLTFPHPITGAPLHLEAEPPSLLRLSEME